MGWLERRRQRKKNKSIGRAQAEAKTVPFLVTVGSGPDGFMPAVTFGGDNLETLLEAAVWSYACITGNAEAAASLQGIVQTEGVGLLEQDWIRDRDAALTEFIENPFGVGNQPDWGWQQVVEVAAQQIYICGNSYWERVDVRRGTRAHIKPIHPSDIEPFDSTGATTGGRGVIAGYRVIDRQLPSAEVRDLRPDQVVHIANASPGSLLRGHAPLSAALRSITIDRTAHLRQEFNLQNKISPGLILNVEGLFGITSEQRTEIVEFLQDGFQKTTDDGRPLVLGEKTTVAASPPTNQQLDYFDTRKFSREEMLAVFRTPPPIVGIYDQATLQNFAEARKIWWQAALFPMLKMINWAFNRQLVDPVYNKGTGPQSRLWFSLTDSDIGLQMFSEKVDVAQKIVNLGFSANTASQHMSLGLPFVEALETTNTALAIAGRDTPDEAEAEDSEADVIPIAAGAEE